MNEDQIQEDQPPVQKVNPVRIVSSARNGGPAANPSGVPKGFIGDPAVAKGGKTEK